VKDSSAEIVLKPVFWVGSSRKDLRSFPKTVQAEIGYALYAAQQGERDPDAKPLKGFGSAQVIEIINRFSGNAYRAVYTVRFDDALYVLHVFQKKSTKGIATTKSDMDLIRARLKDAERFHKERR
jgi:phage-related protein